MAHNCSANPSRQEAFAKRISEQKTPWGCCTFFFSTCSLLSLWHSWYSAPEMEVCVKNKLFCSCSTTNKQTSGTVQSTPLEHSIFLPKKWKWWQMGCRGRWERPDDGAVGAKHWLLKLSRMGGDLHLLLVPLSSINLHLATVRHSFTQPWICCYWAQFLCLTHRHWDTNAMLFKPLFNWNRSAWCGRCIII